MERVTKNGGKGVIGVDQQPCVTGREMLDDFKIIRGDDSFSRCANPEVNGLLEKVIKRENALCKKTGYYVTGDEVLTFNSRFIFTSNSWQPETRDGIFGGKSNPEVEGVRYLVGLNAVSGGVEVIIYVPFMKQKEPYAVFTRGGSDDKAALEVVRAFAAKYNGRLDELEAGKLEKNK
jgi:hypothetical protein